MSEPRDEIAEALAQIIDRRTGGHMGADSWMTTGRESADAILASDWLAQRDRRVAAKAIREAVEEFATGAWNDAWVIAQVNDDVSAVRATEAWFNKQADRIEAGE